MATWILLLPLVGWMSLGAASRRPFQIPIQSGRTTAGWLVLEGPGRWVDRQVLEVTGSGEDSSFWHCGSYRFQPGHTYRFQTRVRRGSGSGTAITGPNFANRDQAGLTSQWQWVGHVFRVPALDGAFLRLGQWHATGAIQFDQVRRVAGRPRASSGWGPELGEGELVRDGQYTFVGTFDHEGSNDHRTLHSASAWFNSDRWTFGEGTQATY